MNCPNCDLSLDVGPVPVGAESRRVIRFVECKCGATTKIATRESWERWHRLNWSQHIGAEWRTDGIEADREEHYRRLAEKVNDDGKA